MPSDQLFIEKCTEITLKHVSEEGFGVSELAEELAMSRSNLLRKVKRATGLSASRFIRKVRLEKAVELLRNQDLTISEIGFLVGFSSTSYFIKCFKEEFGYSPGQLADQEANIDDEKPSSVLSKKGMTYIAVAVAILIVGLLLLYESSEEQKPAPEIKSIAVLPFINDSNDSSNVYFINGLMESTLNDLQKIGGLRVLSRTTSEKYRNSKKSAPEIAEELQVIYLVEGSGQKMGDQFKLNIQLIDARSDEHLWSKQFVAETRDVFKLQQDVAKSIAREIEVVITPQEARYIEKIPTDNLTAYDYYLQGMEYLVYRDAFDMNKAVGYFNKAIQEDPEFAMAYANTAIAYYYHDIFKEDKPYADSLAKYAEKAMLLDPELTNSLMAKAFVYTQRREYELAVSYLEKALVISPNSSVVINLLSDFYSVYVPNTGKYLQYALKGALLNIDEADSSARSITYLHLANALIQAGFVDESREYLLKVEAFNPDMYYTDHIRAFLDYTEHGRMATVQQDLQALFAQDSSRLDILQDIAKVCYMQEHYEEAYFYYQWFDSLRTQYQLNIYPFEDLKMAYVARALGYNDEAERFLQQYMNYLATDETVYHAANLGMVALYEGKEEEALKHLKDFAKQDGYYYWLILFFEDDPMVKKIKDQKTFQAVWQEVIASFWQNHEQIKQRLELERLI